tara:strand:+ start:487 stop:597 length:111 start_codon:yes stop_codon:yes gene_type:complete
MEAKMEAFMGAVGVTVFSGLWITAVTAMAFTTFDSK